MFSFDMQIVYYLLEGIQSSFIFVHVTPAEALASFATIARMKVCPSILEGRCLFLEKRTLSSSPLQRYRFCYLLYNILCADITNPHLFRPVGLGARELVQEKDTTVLTLALRLLSPNCKFCVLCQHPRVWQAHLLA